MKTAVIALTKNGAETALRLGLVLNADVYLKSSIIDKYVLNGNMILMHPFATDFGKLVEKVFSQYDGLVFVMACGIAVRSIAPYLKSKVQDPAVVAADEKGHFAISLISGHLGGANRLAEEVAAVTGGIPVITTATDINNVIAFDLFARDNDCAIENISVLKHISSELVNGGNISLYTDCSLRGAFPPNIERCEAGDACRMAVALTNRTYIPVRADKMLILRPRNLILGIGCKKGKSKEEIEAAVNDFLQCNRRSLMSVYRIASIDLKAREAGIIDFCSDRGIEFVTYPAKEIKLVEGRFESSEFVKQVTGVGNVAEACAVLAGREARLVCRKTVYSGITLALAEEERSYYI